MKMDIASRNVEARFDAAIYFYFATYISYEIVDQGFIISIINDIEEFEFSSIINQNIESELERYKFEIQEIKTLIKRNYGQIFNYKDTVRHNQACIRDAGNYLEDILTTNYPQRLTSNTNSVHTEVKLKNFLANLETQHLNIDLDLKVKKEKQKEFAGNDVKMETNEVA